MMEEIYETLRKERRSFFCSNKMWKELQQKTNNCMSVSQYIRMAIKEQMKKE